ncbi:MAG TPA: peptidylprolyl isomerase [Stellaceae bacterium]|nr:peptidylprolyl isomerase [Stellaceae bacterium]
MSRRLHALAFIASLAAAPGLALAASADDPVVARVDGAELHKSDVEAARRALPPAAQKLPLEQIYPKLLDQLVSGMLITEEGRKAKLADDPEVKQRLAQLSNRVIQQVYIERVIKAAATDEKLRQRYEEDLKTHPPKEEVSARHILVASEDEAKAIIAELDKGADFATLAKAKSTDSSKETGGDLGYFSKDEMLPEFAEAAFKLKKGEYTKTPVHTQFGWHVIKVDDRREAAPPSFEDSKEALTDEIAGEAIGEKLKALRSKAKIETFALDGSPMPAPQ